MDTLHETIRECVAQCEDWSNPLPGILNYVRNLIETKGWQPADAHEVGWQALRLLDPSHAFLQNGDGLSSKAAVPPQSR